MHFCNHSLKRAIVAWSVVIVTCVIGVVLFNTYRYRFFPRNWGVVEGAIYRSGQIDKALIRDLLIKHRIEVVLDLQSFNAGSSNHVAEQNAIRELGLTGFRFPMNGDGTGDPVVVADAVATLARCVAERRRVYVHCAAGTCRTGTVIALYQRLVKGEELPKILVELRRHGRFGQSFEKLRAYLTSHQTEIGERLVNASVISSLPEFIAY